MNQKKKVSIHHQPMKKASKTQENYHGFLIKEHRA